MSVLHNMYPGIIRVQVDGQIIEPRRGLPTVQSMFQSALSQWVDETSAASDVEEERGSNNSYPVINGDSASSSFFVVGPNDGGGTLAGGGQESQVSTTETFRHGGINASLFSEPESQALSDEDAKYEKKTSCYFG